MLQEEIGIELPKRHTRDEMNLAEFPLTLLSTRSDPKIKTLEFKDQIRSRTGETINREWTIQVLINLDFQLLRMTKF